jgi:hypothetical protein
MSKLFRAMEKYRLWLIPPENDAGVWIARTNGGVTDQAYMCGTGATPEEAISDALEGGDRRE